MLYVCEIIFMLPKNIEILSKVETASVLSMGPIF